MRSITFSCYVVIEESSYAWEEVHVLWVKYSNKPDEKPDEKPDKINAGTRIDD